MKIKLCSINRIIEEEIEYFKMGLTFSSDWYFYRGMNPARLLCGTNDCPLLYLKRFLK